MFWTRFCFNCGDAAAEGSRQLCSSAALQSTLFYTSHFEDIRSAFSSLGLYLAGWVLVDLCVWIHALASIICMGFFMIRPKCLLTN